MVSYYSNDDNPNIVIRYTEPAWIHVIRKGDRNWVLLPPDNSYIREIMMGQGNNCLSKITPEEAEWMAERLLEQ